MKGIFFLLPTLFAIFVSFLVVRAAAIALMMTGLDKRRAVFQALSAFTGTGFTTKEAERVLMHPTRRKIISYLMILGNAGIVTVIVATTTTMATSRGYRLPVNIMLLLIGIFVIYKIATSKGFVRRWESYVEEKLIKTRSFVEEAPIEDLLHLIEGYGLVRVIIKAGSPWAGSTLSEFRAGKNDVVLGIERQKEWVPVPKAGEKIKDGDRLIVYGQLDALKEHFKEEE